MDEDDPFERPTKKRGLGRHQRAGLRAGGAESSNVVPTSSNDEEAFVFDSDLIFNALKQWSWGKLYSHDVCSTARASYNDFKVMCDKLGVDPCMMPTSIQHLARCGNWGKNLDSEKRDMLKTLGQPKTPEPSFTNVPCIVSKGRGATRIRDVPFPFMLPDATMQFWYHKARHRFDDFCFGGEYSAKRLTSFWQQVAERRDPRLARHPMCKRPRWQELAIPIVIHGDAVVAVTVGKFGSKSYDVYSFQSVLSMGKSTAVKQYLFGVFKDCVVKATASQPKDTMENGLGILA